MRSVIVAVMAGLLIAAPAASQVPPSAGQVERYEGLMKAAHDGDIDAASRAISAGADLEARDGNGRTAVHIAAFASQADMIAYLAKSGADMNALEHDAYDAVTIAAVANDLPTLRAALEAGNRPDNITSRYDGTALIAAAHLGHHQVVKTLIDAGAPLDHVNNLAWTALIEAVVLGDGGPDHQKCVRHLLDAGADKSIPDRQGNTPLDLARSRGYDEIAAMLGD
ncbi:MAG: ankyrin repeat domain-containing protein [Rhizobiaceae bacterium]